jgi:AhpD family alkylhydroperoxidase
MHPRIHPIDRPKSILARLGFWFIRRDVGKVTTVAKVIYARFPRIMLLVKRMLDIEKRHSLTDTLHPLIQAYVATLNGCSFCIDISSKKARQQNIPPEKFQQLADYRHNPHYPPAEQAALNYVEELTKQVEVSDPTFEALREHWTDREIIEITYAASVENFLNRLVKPLGIGSDQLCVL